MNISTNVIIIGAGDAGHLLLRELDKSQFKEYKIIGFIDDDPAKLGKKIKQFTVLGNTNQIPSIVKENNIDLSIIAIPSAPGKTISRILDIIQKTSSKFMIVSPIFQNLNINTISTPREITIKDIIRSPIENVLTEDSMKKIQDSSILITGVAGSIGSEICDHLAGCFPKEIIGIDVAETPLFNITNSLKQKYEDVNFIPILGNICDNSLIDKIIREYKPNIIYHCAAYKHVGMMEKFPHECVKNNIKGSLNLIDIAIKNKTQRFVFISTDKAVYPVNNMGMSKRIVEKHILSLNSSSTKFMIIRFGNVLESSGSAIPIFKKQIESGGPIRLTDKKMERFFMSLTEAGQLVIQASILGEGGELFVLNMGKPYKMIDIIHKLLNIYGHEKDDFRIEIIGKRPGEKLTEELFHEFEKPELSQHERIYVCRTDHNDDEGEYDKRIEMLLNKSEEMENDELVAKLKELL